MRAFTKSRVYRAPLILRPKKGEPIRKRISAFVNSSNSEVGDEFGGWKVVGYTHNGYSILVKN